jgi:hypothetical protein
MFGEPVVTCLRAFHFAREAAGGPEHPAFPVPSAFQRDVFGKNSEMMISREGGPASFRGDA